MTVENRVAGLESELANRLREVIDREISQIPIDELRILCNGTDAATLSDGRRIDDLSSEERENVRLTYFSTHTVPELRAVLASLRSMREAFANSQTPAE